MDIIEFIRQKHISKTNIIVYKHLKDRVEKEEKLDKEILMLFANLITTLNLSYITRTTHEKIFGVKKHFFLYHKFALDIKRGYTKYINWFIKNNLINLTQDYRYTEGLAKNYELLIPNNTKDIRTYVLTDEKAIKIYTKILTKKYELISDNFIAKQHFKSMLDIELPTKEELIGYAMQLHKNKIKVNGKVFRFNRNRSESDNRSETYYVKDNIEQYEILFLLDKFYIPSEKSGRTYTSFSFLPKWIKQYFYRNGTSFDYSALHPNIIQKLFNEDNQMKFITHDKLSEEMKVKRNIIKIEHLSYFNKRWSSMVKSILHDYYVKNCPAMIEKLYHDKKENGHESTSIKLFTEESNLMKSVCKKLYELNVFVEYAYDELYCLEKDKEIVEAVMNLEAINHGIYTNVSDKSIDDCIETLNKYILVEPNQWLDEVIEITDEIIYNKNNKTK